MIRKVPVLAPASDHDCDSAVTLADQLNVLVIEIGGERPKLQGQAHSAHTAIAAKDFLELNEISAAIQVDMTKYDPRYTKFLDLAQRFKREAALCSKST